MRSWARVTREAPCPICKKPDWCTIGERGICCMRIESTRPMRNGGWFHPFDTHPDPTPRRRTRVPARIRNPDALLARWAASTTPTLVKTLAADLGVSSKGLTSLDAAWAAPRNAWAFPMRDGAGKTIGIRLRPTVGKKLSVQGSRTGLFYPSDFASEVALICEGPTDCAAAITLGFHAVGRPSCSGGLQHLRDLFARAGVSKAIIVADNDEPGRRGALRLASSLDVRTKLLAVPAKDLRAFVQAGATGKLLREMLRWQGWSS